VQQHMAREKSPEPMRVEQQLRMYFKLRH
jgi:hypothetical protein